MLDDSPFGLRVNVRYNYRLFKFATTRCSPPFDPPPQSKVLRSCPETQYALFGLFMPNIDVLVLKHLMKFNVWR